MAFYPFTTKPAINENTGLKTLSYFGNQRNDGSRVAIQGLGNGIQTTDNSATPNKSPLTLTSTVVTLTNPNNGARLTLSNTGATNPLTFSEVSGMASAFTLNPGQSITFDVGFQQLIYVASAVGTTCNFFFTLI